MELVWIALFALFCGAIAALLWACDWLAGSTAVRR